jgi:hypothetical protein
MKGVSRVTREEREAFVRRTWFGDGTAEDAVKEIVDRWEDDNDDVFQRGVWAGQETSGAQG